MIKFMNTRKQIINLDIDYSKRLELNEFKNPEDRTILILIIILLKNINNLIVEVGILGF